MEWPDWLTREIGPLPTWGWIASGVIGVGAGVWLWRAQGGGEPSSEVVVEPYGGASGRILAGAGAGAGGGATNVSDPEPGIGTNAEWRAAALSLALAEGYTAALAATALAAYFESAPLTADQVEVIELAISQLGEPPSPPTLVPPDPGQPPPVQPDPGEDETQTTTYEVKRGDTLSAIAQRFLGRASRYSEIADLNPEISDPDVIYPGQVLVIPSAGAITQPPATGEGGGGGRKYTVQAGDSLSEIAGSQLGNQTRWREIYALNRAEIDNPNLIYPGQVLTLP